VAGCDDLDDGSMVEADNINVACKPSCKGALMVRTITAQMAKRHAAWQHQQQTPHVTQKFRLGLLGLFQAHQYTFKQPHGAFSVQGEWEYSPLLDYDPCGDPFVNENCPKY